jgi:hypothetical protein
MVKKTKTQRLSERMRADIDHSKQTTLGNPPEPSTSGHAKAVLPEQKKRIEIAEIITSTKEDKLVLKVGFKLYPSRTAFSRVTSDLYFNGQKIESLRLRVLQGPLAMDASEFSSVLDMTGIAGGQYNLRVEMYELWASGEKLTCTSKEVTFDHVPLRREDSRVKVPIVRSVAGNDLAIVSDSEKNICREIEENMKKESVSSRDNW